MAGNENISLDDLILMDEDGDLDFNKDATINDPNPQENLDSDYEEDSIEEPEKQEQASIDEQKPETPSKEEAVEIKPEEDALKGALDTQFNLLKGLGALPGLPDDFVFDGTPEKFEEAIQVSNERLQESLLQQVWQALPENFRVVLEYGLNGGTDIDSVKALAKDQIDFNQFDLENLEDQKWLVENYLRKTTKYSDSRIKNQLKYLHEEGLLEEEAETAIQELYKIEQAKKAELFEAERSKQKQLEEQVVKQYESFVTSAAALELPQPRKEQIVQAYWNPIKIQGKNQTYFNYLDGKIKSNPEHLAQLVDIYLTYDEAKGFGMSKKTQQKAQTTAAKDFRNKVVELLSGTSAVHKSSSANQPGVEDFDFKTFLKYSN
jgi:hypothetical protein